MSAHLPLSSKAKSSDALLCHSRNLPQWRPNLNAWAVTDDNPRHSHLLLLGPRLHLGTSGEWLKHEESMQKNQSIKHTPLCLCSSSGPPAALTPPRPCTHPTQSCSVAVMTHDLASVQHQRFPLVQRAVPLKTIIHIVPVLRDSVLRARMRLQPRRRRARAARRLDRSARS